MCVCVCVCVYTHIAAPTWILENLKATLEHQRNAQTDSVKLIVVQFVHICVNNPELLQSLAFLENKLETDKDSPIIRNVSYKER